MATYQQCDETVLELAKVILKQYETHAPILAAKVKIDFLFAFAPRDNDGFPVGDALRLHGNKARGICKIIALKQRALGNGDAEITIDGDWWNDATEDQQAALLDHELHHLVVKLRHGTPMRDDLGRPLLKMRRHDVDFGWFALIAERHGEHSGEREQARQIMMAFGTYFWPDKINAEVTA